MGLGVLYDGTVLSNPIFDHVRARECVRRFVSAVPGIVDIDLHELDRLGFGLDPLDVLVARQEARRVRDGLNCHIFAGPLPRAAFCRATKDVYVSSPEFTFLQMASELSFVDLVMLGYELCGSYSLPEDGRGEAISGCPGVRESSIARLLASADGVHGVKPARKALAQVIDGSNSPMETVTSMFLSLPTIDGGCARWHPLLNHRVEDRPGHHYVVDLFWPAGPLALEYSGFYHATPDRYRQDARRTTDLERAGIKVITLTKDQLRSSTAMEDIARVVSEAIGQPWRKPSAAASLRRGQLLREMLSYLRNAQS